MRKEANEGVNDLGHWSATLSSLISASSDRAVESGENAALVVKCKSSGVLGI